MVIKWKNWLFAKNQSQHNQIKEKKEINCEFQNIKEERMQRIYIDTLLKSGQIQASRGCTTTTYTQLHDSFDQFFLLCFFLLYPRFTKCGCVNNVVVPGKCWKSREWLWEFANVRHTRRPVWEDAKWSTACFDDITRMSLCHDWKCAFFHQKPT